MMFRPHEAQSVKMREIAIIRVEAEIKSQSTASHWLRRRGPSEKGRKRDGNRLRLHDKMQSGARLQGRRGTTARIQPTVGQLCPHPPRLPQHPLSLRTAAIELLSTTQGALLHTLVCCGFISHHQRVTDSHLYLISVSRLLLRPSSSLRPFLLCPFRGAFRLSLFSSHYAGRLPTTAMSAFSS